MFTLSIILMCTLFTIHISISFQTKLYSSDGFIQNVNSNKETK